MKKIFIILNIFAMCFISCVQITCAQETITYADLVDEITNSQKEAIYNLDLNAPFVKNQSGVREDINVETGSLTVNCDIFSLPYYGNGNFGISLVYNSHLSGLKDENVETDSETGNVTANTTVLKNDYERSLGYFGVGWKMNFPYIEKQTEYNKTNIYVHLPDNSVYIADTKTQSGLKDYKLKDVVFNSSAFEKNGITYSYRLIYDNGTIYYFNSDGYMGAVSDKNGNTITYIWETANNIKRLKYIADNAGRTIIFEYSDTQITVSYADRKYTFQRSILDSANGIYSLNSVIDPEGRKTEFKYHTEKMDFNFIPGNLAVAQSDYYLMNEIVYPTGVKTVYDYTKGTKWLYEKAKGYLNYPKIEKRYDESDAGQTNLIKYFYYREPDGYPSHLSDELPENYTYSVFEYDYNNKEIHYVFDGKHNPVKITESTDNMSISEKLVSYDSIFNLPVKSVQKKFNGKNSYLEQTTLNSYDEKGNILRTDTYADGEKAGIYEKNYAYNAYSLCIYEKYLQDENTVIEIRRTADSTGRNIASESIYKNGSLLKTDYYKYNTFGNLIKSSIQTDENTYAETEYIYTAKTRYLYPEKVINKNVVNADNEFRDVQTEYVYDKYGNATQITDGENNTSYYTYDLLGRTVKETMPNGSSRETQYNDKKNIITTVDACGTELIYNYDLFGKLKTVVDKADNTVLLTRKYDKKDRLTETVNAVGTSVSYKYDITDRITEQKTTDKNGDIHSVVTLSYDDAYTFNNKKYMKITADFGDFNDFRSTEYVYDRFERLISKTTGGYTVSYEYDYIGNAVLYTDESGNITENEYDPFGNVVKTVDPMGNVQTFEYNFSNLLTKETNAENESNTYRYDTLGRLIFEAVPFENGVASSKKYYDSLGNLIKEVDGNGNIIENTYNENGLLVSQKSFSNKTEGIESMYTYDGEGRVLTFSYGAIGNEHRKTQKNTYDRFGNLTKTIDNSGKIMYYEYDGVGNITKSTDKNGVSTFYEYDASGNIIKEKNDREEEKTYSYNSFGELIKAVCGNDFVSYTYDSRGLVTKVQRTFTRDNYIYDERGNVTTHETVDSIAGNNKVTYEYDKLNRVTSVITPLGIQNLEYDKANRIIKSSNSQTGIEKTYEYTNRGQLQKSETRKDSDLLYSEINTYDKSGNKVYSNENGLEISYVYDGMNRLSSVKKKNSETVYEYDSYNNIKRESELSNGKIRSKNYYYGVNNELLLEETDFDITQYEYDNQGNLKKKKSDNTEVLYNYDGYNRLSSVIKNASETKYSYNIEGFRSHKTTKDGTTRFIYDGMNISSEIMPDGTIYNYYRANELIGYTNSKNEKVYYNQNSHGDVTAVYDTLGKEIKDYSYNAFGKEEVIKTNFDGANPFLYMWKSETTKLHNPFRYAGEYFDEETGFVYLRNRYYDSSIGRFISEDPIKDGLNWYAYCSNNPIMFVDPSGLYELITNSGNGKVYAKIDLSAGDTLYNIAKSEVGDGSAWAKMGYSGDPGHLSNNQLVDITGIYNSSYPNPAFANQSFYTIPGKNEGISYAIGRLDSLIIEKSYTSLTAKQSYYSFTYAFEYLRRASNIQDTKYFFTIVDIAMAYGSGSGIASIPDAIAQAANSLPGTADILGIPYWTQKQKEKYDVLMKYQERYAIYANIDNYEIIATKYNAKLNNLITDINDNSLLDFGSKYHAINYIQGIIGMNNNRWGTLSTVNEIVTRGY